jgi:hypothetical protein
MSPCNSYTCIADGKDLEQVLTAVLSKEHDEVRDIHLPKSGGQLSPPTRIKERLMATLEWRYHRPG